jgi:endonuclease/exonuclease/phosphatase family metal-dependent hydrolase
LGLGGILLAIAVLAWFARGSFNIQGLDQVRIEPVRGERGDDSLSPGDRTGGGERIRLATFNIQVLGESKLDKPAVVDVLAETIRQFDLVAIQEVRATSQDIVPRLVDEVNRDGARYDYVVGPRLGRTSSKEQYAYVFDSGTIEVDRTSVYTLDDPDDLLHREPLVAGFRTRGPAEDEAFTFTLINIHTDPDETDQELDVLDDVFRAVREDGRGEDDVILLGDLNVDDAHLGQLGRVRDLYWTVSGTPTNTRGTKQYDNILFSARATTEHTGRSGVFDLPQQFRLSQEQALEVSDHLPVWAEFSVYEGGDASRVAGRPDDSR